MFFLLYLALHLVVGMVSCAHDMDDASGHFLKCSIPASFYFWYHGNMNGLEALPGVFLLPLCFYYGHIVYSVFLLRHPT